MFARLLLIAGGLLLLFPSSGMTPKLGQAAEPAVIQRDTLVRGIQTSSTKRAAEEAVESPLPPPMQRGAQAISSVAFVQVYTPFVWGRTSVGGLNVAVTLENSDGTVKGVAGQLRRAPGSDFVRVDRTQLYWETVFVDPAASALTLVNIMPGDRVRVVTTGVDPSSGASATDDRRVVVHDLRAWTHFHDDRVFGTAPAGASIVVTSTTTLNIGGYLTPGTGLTYAETTAGADGSFAVDQFRTSSSATAKKVGLGQGSTGFVRVKHADGSEVFTVHGQNSYVLQNSGVVHGWAFGTANAPTGLDSGVTVTRYNPSIVVALKDAAGQTKDSLTRSIAGNWAGSFQTATIAAGDLVEVSINGAPPQAITVGRLTAAMQLTTNTIMGRGPSGTLLYVAAAKIQGYVMATTSFDYLSQQITTDGAGNYTTPQFNCGATNHLAFRPGSFGYAGYYDVRGNFVYITFAAPTNQVMSEYPFMEGWVASGDVRPAITIAGAGGVKQRATVTPEIFHLTKQKLYLNNYYQLETSDFIVPGDTVSVTSGGWSSTIAVDRVIGWLDSDGDAVVGETTAAANLRVVPQADRASRFEATVGADGRFKIENPAVQISSTCGESSKTFDFAPGDSGRVYVQKGDNNEVFAAYGRSIHVNQNENYIELFQAPTRDLDWIDIPQRTATVTLTPRTAAPLTVTAKSEAVRTGKTKVYLVDGLNQRVLIRAGDSISATFDEGPVGLTRPTTIEVKAMALVTSSPDLEANNLAGVGPRGWVGRATLNAPPTAPAQRLSSTTGPAYGAVRFGSVSLVRGYSGTVSFSNNTGGRVWMAWAVAAVPVKIVGLVAPGDSRVCGTGPVGTTARVHDVGEDGQTTVLGSSAVDGAGAWCATVSTLAKNQVIIAEADGIYSQPVVIGGGNRIMIPDVPRR